MPDVKPSPTAGAIRLSVTRADQKGTRSVSVLVIVACIPGSLIDSRPATEACSHTTSRRLRNGLRPTRLNRKKLAYGQSWSTEPIMLKASRSSCGLHRPRLCAFAHAIILWRSISLFYRREIRRQRRVRGSMWFLVARTWLLRRSFGSRGRLGLRPRSQPTVAWSGIYDPVG